MKYNHTIKKMPGSKFLILFSVIIVAVLSFVVIGYAGKANADETFASNNDAMPVWYVTGLNCSYEYKATPPIGNEEITGSGNFQGTVDILKEMGSDGYDFYDRACSFTVFQDNGFGENDGHCLHITFFEYKLIPKTEIYYMSKFAFLYIYENYDTSWNPGFWAMDRDQIPVSPNKSLSFSKENLVNAHFYSTRANPPFNVAGRVFDDANAQNPIDGAYVQYWQLTPWGEIPVFGAFAFTDIFGHYFIPNVGGGIWPGVVRVYKDGYEIGESEQIGFVPLYINTVFRSVQLTKTPPVPPVPPTPPDPPVPPGPVPPQPVPPVPPTPVNPDNPGGGIAQTGDNPVIPLVIFGIFALSAVGVLKSRKMFCA